MVLWLLPHAKGLFAPHWRDDARGLIIGLTQFHTKVSERAISVAVYLRRPYYLAQCNLISPCMLLGFWHCTS
jgi:hypothetical protein